jgi:glucans biosynthesis protein
VSPKLATAVGRFGSKRLTVNADQAVVTDQVVTGKQGVSPALLRAVSDKPMPTMKDDRAGGGGADKRMSINHMRHCNAAFRCRAASKRSGQRCRAPAVRGWQVCRMHGARGVASHGKRNGNYKHGGRTKEVINAGREVNALLRYIRKCGQGGP